MDKLKKVGLTALGTALVSSSAIAAEMAVSGGATLTFNGGDKVTSANGWTGNDSINFSASTDLDNGFTVSHTQNIDGGASGNNALTTIGMGSMGTLEFHHSSGSDIVSAWDDMMPSANEESWDSLTGTVGGTGPTRGAASSNMFRYHLDVMDGVTISASYVPSGTGEAESSTSYGVKFTGVEGLTVGLVTGENNDQVAGTGGNAHGAGKTIENTNMFLTYAIDAFTIGVQNNESDSGTANADYDYRGYGISYAVSEDISVSYGIGKVEYENSSLLDQDTSALSASFTNGSVTVSATMNEGDNLGGSSAASADKNAYELNIGFAF
jgi:outer membrane protein OmpU